MLKRELLEHSGKAPGRPWPEQPRVAGLWSRRFLLPAHVCLCSWVTWVRAVCPRLPFPLKCQPQENLPTSKGRKSMVCYGHVENFHTETT